MVRVIRKHRNIPQHIDFSPHRRLPLGVINFDKILAELNLHDRCKIPTDLQKR